MSFWSCKAPKNLCCPCFPLRFRSDFENAHARHPFPSPVGQRMSYMEDCFAGAPQEFLICITVHKAVMVGVTTGDLYVRISLDKMTKSTKSFPNTENPFFNEVSVEMISGMETIYSTLSSTLSSSFTALWPSFCG